MKCFCFLTYINASSQAYGRELLEARECCLKYGRTLKDAELTQVRNARL